MPVEQSGGQRDAMTLQAVAGAAGNVPGTGRHLKQTKTGATGTLRHLLHQSGRCCDATKPAVDEAKISEGTGDLGGRAGIGVEEFCPDDAFHRGFRRTG